MTQCRPSAQLVSLQSNLFPSLENLTLSKIYNIVTITEMSEPDRSPDQIATSDPGFAANSHTRSVRFIPDAMPDDGARRPLLHGKRPYTRSVSHSRDELRSFRSWLRWMCVDQTSAWRTALSWSVFIVAAVAVPGISHFVLSYDDRRRKYDAVVQASLTALSALSFLCLSAFVRRYGLRRFLFLDMLCTESETVRFGYTDQLKRSFKMLSIFVLPCFLAETVYRIWWYQNGAGRIPFLANKVASDTVICVLELFSWLYRTSIFFLVCVLFRLTCHLQILRLEDFNVAFQEESAVGPILAEHLRVRRHLHIISHRFRIFIVLTLLLVTLSQLTALLLTTKANAVVNVFNAGELALCSMTIVSGLFLCLRSAAKITHKAQAITSHAAKWLVFATIESAVSDLEAAQVHQLHQEEFAAADDHLDDSLRMHYSCSSTVSFQERQALVKYLEHNKAGITIFGFTLDRSTLHTIFGVELTLILWLLGKTIGIS